MPGLRFPVVSDTINYALLGQSLWEEGRYALNGAPYANHLPLHAFVSYPLTRLFGVHPGMHLLSLLGGFGVLIATFFLTRRLFSFGIGAATTLAVLVHPAFVLMSMVGSADLSFATLLLLSLFFFLKAEADTRWYMLAGILLGLACLTRYNGLPFFLLFLGWVLWKRRSHVQSWAFWGGLAAGGLITGMWFLRNALVFGNPLYSGYRNELAQEAPNIVEQFISNIFYYINPVHNLFPFFFAFALVGLWFHARRQPFLILAMLAAWVISMIWWVQAIRFLFPGYPLLLAFSVLGIAETLRRFRRSTLVIGLLIAAGIAVQSLSLCLYTYGDCNAWFDRTIGVLPKHMGLTPEGFYAWHVAREYIDAHAERNAFVFHESPSLAEGIFRSDLRPTDDTALCPLYRITQRPEEGDDILFVTEAAPATSVVLQRCP